MTELEIGGGSVRKERFQTLQITNGTSNAFADGPKEDISTEPGGAIPPTRIRMPIGRTLSGGAHGVNAGKANIRLSHRGCLTGKNGAVLLELRTPV